MKSRSEPAAATPEPGGLQRAAWLAATCGIAATAVLYRLGVSPIFVYDEARLANNALEMSYDGFSLVTTYDGAPDHWNTKPPLLIWAMALSIRVFGATEWSVRLPSALAAVATCMLLFWFCLTRSRRPLVGFLAPLMLLASPVFLGWHGARSGNYDVPLALCTTAYLCAGYLSLAEPGRVGVGWLWACAAGIVLAFLTKSVQGLLFVPGLALYVLVRGQGRAVLRLPATWTASAAALAVCAGFHAAREAMDPGYVASALTNDVVGRYASVIERHDGPWWFYLAHQWLVVAGLGAALLLALLGTGERRRLGAFLLIVSASYLAIISAAATKLWWYTIPLLPSSAVAVAVGMDELLQRTGDAVPAAWRRRVSGAAAVVALIAAALVMQRAMLGAHQLEAGLRQSERDHYSLILRSDALRSAPVRRFDVAHPGYPAEHAAYYVAPALFYVQALRRRGFAVNLAPPDQVWAGRGRHVVLCGSQVTDAARRNLILAPLVRVASCGLFPRRITHAEVAG